MCVRDWVANHESASLYPLRLLQLKLFLVRDERALVLCRIGLLPGIGHFLYKRSLQIKVRYFQFQSLSTIAVCVSASRKSENNDCRSSVVLTQHLHPPNLANWLPFVLLQAYDFSFNIVEKWTYTLYIFENIDEYFAHRFYNFLN